MTEPLAGLASGSVALATCPRALHGLFCRVGQRARQRPLTSIAIVDDDPAGQYLYPEFQLYQRLLAQPAGPPASSTRERSITGRRTRSRRPAHRSRVQPRDGLYFAERASLRAAATPRVGRRRDHPASCRAPPLGDKRLLAWLRDATLLREAGLDDVEQAELAGRDPAHRNRGPRCRGRTLASPQGPVLQARGRLRQQGGLPGRQAHARDVRAHPGAPLRGAGRSRPRRPRRVVARTVPPTCASTSAITSAATRPCCGRPASTADRRPTSHARRRLCAGTDTEEIAPGTGNPTRGYA